MPGETATALAYVGAFAGLLGGGIALFNSWKAVRWKRAELANSYIKDFNSNQELVFSGRCLDWYGGPLVVPEALRPFLPDGEKLIVHDRLVFENALRANLTVGEMSDDRRLQLYRTAFDTFLSWMSLVCSALERNLFKTADIEDVGYWIAKLESDTATHDFIAAFGYKLSIDRLTRRFRKERNVYKSWRFPTVRRGGIISGIFKVDD